MTEFKVKLVHFEKVVGEIFPRLKKISTGEKEYENCIKHREFWDNLENIGICDIKEIVIPFLNRWHCRLPYISAQDLTQALHDIEPWLQPLRVVTIEDENLLRQVQIQGERVRILALIQRIFEAISKVRAGKRTVAFTATTKILHMTIPNFFVMGDAKIRKHYGCDGTGVGFANFMWRMGIFARDLITQTQGKKQEILNFSKWKGRTLPRLIDNYNYTRFTREEV